MKNHVICLLFGHLKAMVLNRKTNVATNHALPTKLLPLLKLGRKLIWFHKRNFWYKYLWRGLSYEAMTQDELVGWDQWEGLSKRERGELGLRDAEGGGEGGEILDGALHHLQLEMRWNKVSPCLDDVILVLAVVVVVVVLRPSRTF